MGRLIVRNPLSHKKNLDSTNANKVVLNETETSFGYFDLLPFLVSRLIFAWMPTWLTVHCVFII